MVSYNDCSVSHQLSTHLLPAFISPQRIIALTNVLHRNNHLGRLCLHTKLCTHTFFDMHTELVES